MLGTAERHNGPPEVQEDMKMGLMSQRHRDQQKMITACKGESGFDHEKCIWEPFMKLVSCSLTKKKKNTRGKELKHLL